MIVLRMVMCMLVIAGAFDTANGQGKSGLESIDALTLLPPSAIRPGAIEDSKETLKWLIRRNELQANRMRMEVTRLNKMLRDVEDRQTISAFEQLGNLAFTTDAVREQLISQVLQTLLNARIEIAAKEALVKNLSEEFDTFKPDSAVMRHLEAQAKTLARQLDLLKEKQELLQAQNRSGGAATRVTLIESLIGMEDVAGKLAMLDFQKELKTHEGKASIAKQLSDLRLDLHQLKAREEAAEAQLEQLAGAFRSARALKQTERQAEQLLEQLKVRNSRMDRALLDIEGAKLLLSHLDEYGEAVKKSSNARIQSTEDK